MTVMPSGIIIMSAAPTRRPAPAKERVFSELFETSSLRGTYPNTKVEMNIERDRRITYTISGGFYILFIIIGLN